MRNRGARRRSVRPQCAPSLLHSSMPYSSALTRCHRQSYPSPSPTRRRRHHQCVHPILAFLHSSTVCCLRQSHACRCGATEESKDTCPPHSPSHVARLATLVSHALSRSQLGLVALLSSIRSLTSLESSQCHPVAWRSRAGPRTMRSSLIALVCECNDSVQGRGLVR